LAAFSTSGWLEIDFTRVAMEKDAHFGDRTLVPQAPPFFSCASFASCHIPLSLNDPIVQWPRTLPFHGSNTGSNPVRVAEYRKCFTLSYLCRLIWMKNLDFANKIAKTSTEIHCFKTNLGNSVVGPLGSRRNFRNSTTGTDKQNESSG